MADEYVVPLGVDAKQFFDGINSVTQAVDKLEKKAVESAGVMNKTMKESAASATILDDAIKKNQQNIGLTGSAAKALGSDVQKGFDTAPVDRFTKYIEQAKKNVAEMNVTMSQTARAVPLAFDPNNLKNFIQTLRESGGAVTGVSDSFTKTGGGGLMGTLSNFKKQAGEAFTSFKNGAASAFGKVTDFVGGLISEFPILGGIIGGVAIAAIKGFYDWATSVDRLSDKERQLINVTETLRDLNASASQASALEIGQLDLLYGRTQDLTKSVKERTEAALELQKTYPVTFGNLTVEAILAGDATNAYNLLRDSIYAKNRAEAFGTILKEKSLKNAKSELDLLSDLKDAEKQLAEAKASNTQANDKRERVDGGLMIVPGKNTLVSAATAKVQMAKDAIKKNKEAFYLENSFLLDEKVNDDKMAAIAIANENKRVENEKKVKEIREKADKAKSGGKIKAKGSNEPASADLQEAENQKLIKLLQELKSAELKTVDDITQYKIQKLQQDFDNKKQSIEQEIALIEKSEARLNKKKVKSKDDIELLATLKEEKEAQNKLLVQLEKNKDDDIADVNKDAHDKATKLQQEGYKMLYQMQEKNLQSTLKLIDIEYDERAKRIEENYKNEVELKAKLLAALSSQKGEKVKGVKLNDGQSQLKMQEDILIKQLQLSTKYSGNEQAVERLKQLGILQIKLDFAKKNLDLLIASGAAENDIAVLNARLLIKSLDSEFQKQSKGGLAEWLGIDSSSLDAIESAFGETGTKIRKIAGNLYKTLTDDNKGTIEKIGAVAQAVSDAAQIAIDAIHAQIEAKQEQIDMYTQQIDELQGQVDRETELQREGLANNLEKVQAEIAAKKKLRDDEQKQKEELAKRQKQMQKAQLAADTVAQLSGLITASVDIIKGFAQIPIVGVALGIAAVAAMFGFFISSKVKAAQAIDKQTLGEGGWVKGNPHTAGGVKYHGSGGDVVELEGQEFVINKNSAAKHSRIADALNKDDFSGLSFDDQSFKKMMADMGIKVSDEQSKAINLSKDVSSGSMALLAGLTSKGVESYLKKIDANTKVIADDILDRVTVEETSTHRTERSKNKTRVIKKN